MKQLLAVTVVSIVLAGTAAGQLRMPKTIIVGAVYNTFHEEYDTDSNFFAVVNKNIALMKASNINHVMVFPLGQWDPDSRKLLWTRTDFLIKNIEQSGMKFVPLMLKEEQCSHYFPIWKFKDIKGMWEEHNLDNGNKNNRQDVDFADPRVYPLVEEYFKAVVERYGKSPALSFYNIWNEPHYHSSAEHVLEQFRSWLKRKYGALPAVRHAWGKEYSDWTEVSPFLNDNWNSSMPQIDWILFRNDLDGSLLGKLKQTLRTYDTVHSVNANPVGTPWASFANFGSYNVDNWAIADEDDVPGISYYPDIWEREHNLQPCPYWLHNLALNTVRCAAGEKEYILTELYTNAQNGLALNGYLGREDVSLLAWTALANDCKGIIYWKWDPFMRGRQSLGRGLTRIDGELAPRGEAVKDVGAIVKKYGDLLYEAHPKKAQVAILLDMVGLLKNLEQSTEPATTKFMYESNAGLFKALFEANISVDMLRMDRGLSLEQLKPYKIVFLPFQIVMRQNVADLLKTFVRQGGWVVADARTATVDELDFAYRTNPGAGLDQLFGAVRSDWVGQKGYFRVQMKEQNGDSAFQFNGKFFKDVLRLRDSVDVVGYFAGTNDPAVIQHPFGRGMAVLSAVPLGGSYYEDPANPVNRLLLDLTTRAGVSPDARFVSPNAKHVSVKVHTLKDGYVIYVINSGDQPASAVVQLGVGQRIIHDVKNIVSDESIRFEQKEDGLSFPVQIKARQAFVFLAE